MRLHEAKEVIKKMLKKRSGRKKRNAQRVDTTVTAMIASSVSSQNSGGFPQESLVTLSPKPTLAFSKKGQSDLRRKVLLKTQSPSPVNGSHNGTDGNGLQPPRKSKKLSISPKNSDNIKGSQVFESPSLDTENPKSMLDVLGMSTAYNNDNYQDESPHVRPSGVRKVYGNKKKSDSVSNMSGVCLPYGQSPMPDDVFGFDDSNEIQQSSTSGECLPYGQSPMPDDVFGFDDSNEIQQSSTSGECLPYGQSSMHDDAYSFGDSNEILSNVPKTKNSRIKLLYQDITEDPNLDIKKTQPTKLKGSKNESKKSLKLLKKSINIRKKCTAPTTIKKISTRVKFPGFTVTSDDISSKSDLKTAQFYKSNQKSTVKSGFSVTTVSDKKLPLNSDSSNNSEFEIDEQSLDGDESDGGTHSNGSDDENEDVSEENVNLGNFAENIPFNKSTGVQFHFIDGQVILHLEHPSTFTFCGQVQVKVLKGAVEVLGCLLLPSNGFHTVFSLPGIGLLPLQSAVPPNEDQSDRKLDMEYSYLADSLLKEGKKNDVFLLMKKSESVLPFFVSQFVDLELFPSKDDMESDTLFSKASRKLQCLCDPPEGSNIVKKGELWDQISEDIIQNPGCTVLCGGKGVGKSTLLRFFINRLLSNGSDKVVVIDFDPGQAELTVPGCVSLAIVKNAMLGPNFTHLENPLKCIYVGEINVSNSVSRYMDACLTIISFWQSDEELKKMPCIVNTMGFTRGIGVTIMVQLLSALQPSRVVQILSKVSQFNYPEVMSVEYVKKSCLSSPFTVNLDSTKHTQRHTLFNRGSLNFETNVIQSGTDFGRNVHNIKGFDPRRRREAVILSYLSQMVSPPNFSILDIVPYSCPLESLYIHICHESVPPAVTLSAFNASLVGLCCVNPPEEDVVRSPGSGYPSVITKRFIVDCLGFGVVRGIDMDTRLLYLLTPIPTKILASVNCLVLGAVNLPSSLYFSPPREVGAVPYVVQNAMK